MLKKDLQMITFCIIYVLKCPNLFEEVEFDLLNVTYEREMTHVQSQGLLQLKKKKIENRS